MVERKNFCVGLPWPVVIAAADNAAVLDHEGADHGVRAGLTQALRRETKRQGHEVEMRRGGGHRFLRVTRGRLRGCGADFVFVDFVVFFVVVVVFAFVRGTDRLRGEGAALAPASAKAAWAAASRAMPTR